MAATLNPHARQALAPFVNDIDIGVHRFSIELAR